MIVSDLVLELTGCDLTNHMDELGLDRSCLDREVQIETSDEFLRINDVRFDGERNAVVIQVE